MTNRAEITDRTYRVNSFYVSEDWLISKFGQKAEKLAEKLNSFIEAIEPVLNNRFIVMQNKDVWLDRNVAGLYPKQNTLDIRCFDRDSGGIEYLKNHKDVTFEGLDFHIPSRIEGKITFFATNGRPYFIDHPSIKYFNSNNSINSKWFCVEENNTYFIYEFSGGSSYRFDETNSDYRIVIPIHRLRNKLFDSANDKPMEFEETLSTLNKYKLIPSGLNEKYTKQFLLYSELFLKTKEYISKENNIFKLDTASLMRDMLEGKFEQTIDGIDYSLAKFLSGEKKPMLSKDDVERELLECDHIRADLAIYKENRITDSNRGHWELAEQGDELIEVSLPTDDDMDWVARPPQLDIVRNGTCAIDFGTKSTVVACRRNDERLLRIGKGDFMAKPTMEDYENPTAIKFLDIKGFEKSYAMRIGRPFTRWADQAVVSHAAVEELDHTDNSGVYYSVFSELKQWANDRKRHLKIKDSLKHYTLELKPYLELDEDDFDPIEAYAYYLGLYINNMTNGIFLDYILSFPVNYAKDVRDKLLSSFTRGLKKSLPPAILKDEKAMRLFRVYAGASEPAAYAISALKEFGLEPKATDAQVAYAVFDFGGGTTDFDFGYEEVPKNGRSKFVIHQFGKGGDVYLGGENLLDLMTYEVFKRNEAVMREKNISFVLPPDSSRFAGSEGLVLERQNASQEAYMNTKRLAETLRPVWERHEDYQSKYDKGKVPVQLFSNDKDADGNNMVSVDVDIDTDVLEKLIYKRIESGVENFFRALHEAFGQDQPKPIHIFLAGNSCKSPVVKELFDKYIAAEEKEMRDSLYKLHLPLGLKIVSEFDKAEATLSSEKFAEIADKILLQGMSKKDAILSSGFGEEDVQKILDYFDAEANREDDDGEDDDMEIVDAEDEISPDKLDQVRTGKTGVAFGLLRSRKGGRDVKIINKNVDKTGEMTFPYLLGEIGADDHFKAVIDLKVGYNEWKRFCYADEEDFELYYTAEAKALSGQMDSDKVNMVRCIIDSEEVDEDRDIYIRKTAPNKIEYTAATEEEISGEESDLHIYSQILD